VVVNRTHYTRLSIQKCTYDVKQCVRFLIVYLRIFMYKSIEYNGMDILYSEKSTVTDKLYHIIFCRVHLTMNGVQAHNLSGARIYIVERIRISYFLALSRVARFYATTAEQNIIHSFWNGLRIRRKINQLHQSSCYRSSIYYITQHIPWICRYRFNCFFIFTNTGLKCWSDENFHHWSRHSHRQRIALW
jgi:hypothetical protein